MPDENKIGFTPPAKRTSREPARTNLERYLGVTIQMLMARTDGRDDNAYLEKLDELYKPLTDEEIQFINEIGKDWATHRWCESCQGIQPNSHKCKEMENGTT